MSDLNDVKLFGRVVRDAELKKTQGNLSIAVFSIAVNHASKKEDGNWENKADFFPLAIYGTYAENMVSKLKKGQKLIIQGYLKQNKWEKDGVKHSETSVGVRTIQIIYDTKSSGNDVKENEMTVPEYAPENDFTEEQLAEMYTSEAERLSGEDVF